MPTNRYKEVDIAIVGSGIGGLCAAAFAVKAGYRILVVEKLPRIGGRWTTIDYKGFKIHTGGLGAEMGTGFEQTLKQAGVEYEVRPLTPIRYWIKGKEYVSSGVGIPPPEDIKKFLTLCSNEEEAERVMAAMFRAFTWQEPSSKISLRDWVLQYTHSGEILKLFQLMAAGGLGVNSDTATPADLFYSFKAGSFRHWGLMPEGPAAITGRLAKVVQDKGGEVWTRSFVRRIRVEDGRVKGIVVEKEGREMEVSAQAVLSNTGPKKTIDLVGAESFDRGYLREIRETLIPMPYIDVYTMSDRPLTGPGGLAIMGARRVFYALCSTHSCPEHAPSGKHLLQTCSIPSSTSGPVDYRKELDLQVQDLKDLFPDFERHGKILMACTYHGEWPCLRNLPGLSIPQKTPIELLYNVGDCFGNRGNIAGPGAVESAKLAMEDLINRIKPR